MERVMYMIISLIVLAYFLNRAGEQDAVVWMSGLVVLAVIYMIVTAYLDKKAKKKKEQEEEDRKQQEEKKKELSAKQDKEVRENIKGIYENVKQIKEKV